ncbi:hypothetical protein BCR39DRAFT_532250 [Naematelia encephala]|uniref:Uncharacterized protein n=1 Tax=Naematelia encephala TaxID=71784 RepID=A0A1Y2B3A5_9TREE|nr:hypothetical protein BCR39DRAFT_532250 [Naematelia encephala]
MLMGENLHKFQTEGHYLGNDVATYGGDPNNGYVEATNIPKHLGGAIFAAAFDVSMMIIIVLSMCADVFWRFKFTRGILEMFFVTGLYAGEHHTHVEYFFVIANAFLKIFICAATGAETFTGLRPQNSAVDTNLFCLYAVLILLCSIPLTIIATMFSIQGIKVGNWRAERASDERKRQKAAQQASQA